MMSTTKDRINLTRFIAVVIAFLILFSRNGWGKSGIAGDILFCIGLLLTGLATVGRGWCLLYIAGYKSKTLITKGPYSLSRHPLYLFSLIGSLGVGFASELITVTALLLIGFGLYYPLIIKKEERKLARLHGEAYKIYCENTPAFLPLSIRIDEPSEYVVRPRAFRKGLFDTLWFVWIVGILKLIESLHEFSIIPTFFTLY
jgi:protein-S-isoprenylcysteine O-methyltransferase Ste14